jgi:hypothetical protein
MTSAQVQALLAVAGLIGKRKIRVPVPPQPPQGPWQPLQNWQPPNP